ncbi:MAG: adenosylcobinamide-phosphate synthase CbiB [Cyanobacteria bacterium P01_G01_bin.67]
MHLVSFSTLILLFAAFADYLIGDPWGWIHPVQVMGWIIQKVSVIVIKFRLPCWQRRLAGSILGILLIGGSGFFGWVIVTYSTMINLWFGKGIAIVLLASCFAGKSLRVAVQDVIKPLDTGDLLQARSRLSLYVGRDTDNLSQSEISRALLETVAENAVDGVTAPLFYGIVGSFLTPGAVSLALAYKAASTLDSMIGYLREPYKDLGWFSAQLEDRLTWVPCRLTVLTLSLLSGKPFQVWQICCRDGVKDPSPNSGWSEAAYAAILEVQLGGENTYKGVVTDKPLLGDGMKPISVVEINQALSLTRSCFLVWLAIAVMLDILL